jgi:hypothetical protein
MGGQQRHLIYQTINHVYRIARSWVKLTIHNEGGTVATCVTVEDNAKQARNTMKIKRQKRK